MGCIYCCMTTNQKVIDFLLSLAKYAGYLAGALIIISFIFIIVYTIAALFFKDFTKEKTIDSENLLILWRYIAIIISGLLLVIIAVIIALVLIITLLR